MTDRPILFSAPMVRAILAGQKTQTRRVVKLPHQNPLGVWEPHTIGGPNGGRLASGDTIPEQGAIWHTRTGDSVGCPYGQPGDRLWVRETWAPNEGSHGGFLYRADHNDASGFHKCDLKTSVWTHSVSRWKPSIHMPRTVSRITLNITGVRVERLQTISREDAIAEGIEPVGDRWRHYFFSAKDTDEAWEFPQNSFGSLWASINGAESWDANPWVWVVEFERAAAALGEAA